MKKIIRNIIIIVYAIIAIAVTVCLLSYNQYKVPEFGNKSLVIIDDNNLVSGFKKGQLVILDKSKDPKVGDEIFFYNTSTQNVEISCAKLLNIDKTGDTVIYTIPGTSGSQTLSGDYLIGSSGTAVKIGVLGSVLGFLESKWGFLFLIVLPLLLAFLYEIVEVIMEVRGKGKEKGRGRSKHDEDDKN